VERDGRSPYKEYSRGVGVMVNKYLPLVVSCFTLLVTVWILARQIHREYAMARVERRLRARGHGVSGDIGPRFDQEED